MTGNTRSMARNNTGWLIACAVVTAAAACAVVLSGALLAAPPAAPPAAPAERARVFVTAGASALVDQGLAAAAPTGAEVKAFQEVPSPGLRFVANVAQATTAPWVDSNASRFQRGMRQVAYPKLAAGAASLAAAEAFTFGAEVILSPEPADVEELGKMLQFLKANEAPRLPILANIGVVDSQSPLMGEVLNLLSRRNLLYRVVAKPDRALDLTLQLGTPEFPEQMAANPSDFAAHVRAKLGDDKRLVRLYQTSTVIAHLTGDGKTARLYLLSYGGPRRQGAGGGMQAGTRVRVLGRYRPTKVAAYGAPADAALTDVDNPGDATEFTVPAFRTLAIVDLSRTP
jgi:hypothetical protein